MNYFPENGERKFTFEGFVYSSPHRYEYYTVWKCDTHGCHARIRDMNQHRHRTVLAEHNHPPRFPENVPAPNVDESASNAPSNYAPNVRDAALSNDYVVLQNVELQTTEESMRGFSQIPFYAALDNDGEAAVITIDDAGNELLNTTETGDFSGNESLNSVEHVDATESFGNQLLNSIQPGENEEGKHFGTFEDAGNDLFDSAQDVVGSLGNGSLNKVESFGATDPNGNERFSASIPIQNEVVHNIEALEVPYAQQIQVPEADLHSAFEAYHTDFEIDHLDATRPLLFDEDFHEHDRTSSPETFDEEERQHPFAEYAKIKDDETFLMHDSGNEDPDRIILFSTEKNMKLLKESDYWGINCVIKKVPKPFIRVWVIQGFHLQKSLPFAYFLARSSNDETFNRVLGLLPDDVRPKHVMMDYKRKEYKMAQEFFPDARFHLCYFYFTSELMKKIASLRWRTPYVFDFQFHIDAKSFMMLSFVKPGDVQRYYGALKETFVNRYNEQFNVAPFFAYMEETWIGNPETEAAPVYPLELWNVYDSTILGYPRTNNFFKTWLSQYYATYPSPTYDVNYFDGIREKSKTIYEFIDNIKEQQRLLENCVDQLDHGITRAEFRKQTNQMLRVVENYDNYEPYDYLQAVAIASCRNSKHFKVPMALATMSPAPMAPAQMAPDSMAHAY